MFYETGHDGLFWFDCFYSFFFVRLFLYYFTYNWFIVGFYYIDWTVKKLKITKLTVMVLFDLDSVLVWKISDP